MSNPKIWVLIYPDTRQLDNKSFDYRAWGGLSIILDVLQRAGYEIGYCPAEDAAGKVVLATVPSARSWYPLVNAWLGGNTAGATLILGGSGVLNVRPVLPLPGAVFVLGRGETLVTQVVEAALGGDYVDSPHVIYPARFSADQDYWICQGAGNYPHPVQLANGDNWLEEGQGCPYQCYFCNYTWARTKPPAVTDYGRQISGRGAVVAGASNLREHNLSELVKAWRHGYALGLGGWLNSAIDGQSERIRRAVKKPVTRQMLRLVGELAPQNCRVSLMTVIGFPGETEEDRREALDDLIVGLQRRTGPERWAIEVSPNAFRPMPATPLAWAATQVENWHYLLRREWGAGVGGYRDRLWSREDGRVGLKMYWTVGGAWYLLSELVIHRGTEADWPSIVRVARSKRFWQASARVKEATLARYFDVAGLAQEFDAEGLPSYYLNGRRPNADLYDLWKVARAQLLRVVNQEV